MKSRGVWAGIEVILEPLGRKAETLELLQSHAKPRTDPATAFILKLRPHSCLAQRELQRPLRVRFCRESANIDECCRSQASSKPDDHVYSGCVPPLNECLMSLPGN